MSRYYTVRTDEGIKVCFAVVRSNGTLRTGLASGDFTVTVINPNDDATTTPTVTQMSQKTGMYCFTIPTAGWLATHGVGVYAFVVEITMAVSPPPNVITAFSGNAISDNLDIIVSPASL